MVLWQCYYSFFVFPPIARKYGILRCLRVVTFLYPFIYFATPFAVLLPTSTTREVGILCILIFKCLASVFAFPSSTILLTKSAGSLRLLSTLNGLATSISAAGRSFGPFTIGSLFTWGLKIDYIVIPWWTLAFYSALGHIPTWWLLELEGFGSKGDQGNSDDGDDNGKIAGQSNFPERSRQNAEYTPIMEETEFENEENADPTRPLLSPSYTYSYNQPATYTILKAASNSSWQSTHNKHITAVVSDYIEDDESLAPIGIGQSAHKCR